MASKKRSEKIEIIPTEDITYKKVNPAKVSNFQRIRDRFIERFKDKPLLITLWLRSGKRRTFFVPASSQEFTYKKGKFIIDEKQSRYDSMVKCHTLLYHEDLSIPIPQKIDIKKAKSCDPEVSSSLDPSLLKDFIKREVIAQAMRGADADGEMKRLRFLIFITLLSSIITLLLMIQQSGMLENVGI